jgi:hypothetical protein
LSRFQGIKKKDDILELFYLTLAYTVVYYIQTQDKKKKNERKTRMKAEKITTEYLMTKLAKTSRFLMDTLGMEEREAIDQAKALMAQAAKKMHNEAKLVQVEKPEISKLKPMTITGYND